MHPQNADENEWGEPPPEPDPTKSGRKRGLLFGGVGAVVVAVPVIVLAIVGSGSGSGDQPANVAAEASSTATQQNDAADTTSREQPQPPGTVRLPGGSTAALVKKELTDNGTLPIPQDLNKATWWGASLGESGAMLLSGHVNWKGEAGPFKELLSVEVGQKVTVLDDSGEKWTYQIRDVRKVSKAELPSVAPELFSQDGEHRLVLVTCGGEFVGGETGYAANVIAVARLVSSPH